MAAGACYIASAQITQGTSLPKAFLFCVCVSRAFVRLLQPLPSNGYGVAAYFMVIAKQWIYMPQYEWHERLIIWGGAVLSFDGKYFVTP
jgi:hypothetical protein